MIQRRYCFCALAKLESGKITQADYDRWRRYYPKYEQESIRTNLPPEDFFAELTVDEK